ncbi:MAG: hypothetical protein ACRDZ2_07755 [Ilumatobacteraceae bacterium]
MAFALDGVVRERRDDTARLFRIYSAVGSETSTLAYDADENAAADHRIGARTRKTAETELLDQLAAGIAQIVTARNAATADAATATTAKTQAEALSGQIAARKTTVDNATLTLNLASLNAIKAEVSYLLAQVKIIVDAFAQLQAWRRAVDENAVTTDNALLWLAKHASGEVTAPENRTA